MCAHMDCDPIFAAPRDGRASMAAAQKRGGFLCDDTYLVDRNDLDGGTAGACADVGCHAERARVGFGVELHARPLKTTQDALADGRRVLADSTPEHDEIGSAKVAQVRRHIVARAPAEYFYCQRRIRHSARISRL